MTERREPLRMMAVQDPVIPVVGAMVRERPGTISLGQGVVYYGPPPAALARIPEFLADPENHKYRAVQGIPALLSALENKLKAENGIMIGGDSRLLVTAGGNMAFMNAVLAISDPGDEFLLQSPFYFNHDMAIAMAGCRSIPVPTDASYQLQIDAIEAAISPRARAVVTVSPNNPTGAVYPEEALRAVNALCEQHGLFHIHDEAYEHFTYGAARNFSPGSIPGAAGHTISLYSFSKSYGFASWRVGYMVIPDHLFGSVQEIQDTILICPPVISQYGALGALEAGPAYCQAKRVQIEANRETMLRELNRIPEECRVPPADGAFYFLIQVQTPLGAMAVTSRLVQDHGVAVIPGTAFGLTKGCALRVAYASLDEATAAEGIERLISGLKDVCRLSG
jgi:aspartate/methionine/tyrosine aminotransferase